MRRVYRYIAIFILLISPAIFVYIKWTNLVNFCYAKSIDEGFYVQKINVSGVNFFDQHEVIKALNITPDTSIFSLDLNQMLAKLLLTLTWIKDAKIERVYPNLLIVKINERKPIAYFQQKSELFLIDSDGVLIKSDRTVKNGIIFYGELANKYAAQLLDLLKKHKITGVTEANYIGNRRWNILLNGTVMVKLPETGAEKALEELHSLIESKRILENGLSIIDFRLPDKILIKENKGRVNYKEI